MEDLNYNPVTMMQRITINCTKQELAEGTFRLPDVKELSPQVELQFFVPHEGRETETRFAVSRQMLQDAPALHAYVGTTVLRSIAKLL